MVSARQVHYIFEGQKMDRDADYKPDPQSRGRAKILANAQVEFRWPQSKTVFVRNNHKSNWQALLTTNVALPMKT
jgi:hypothetical protein